MRFEWAPIRSVKTGSTFCSSATCSVVGRSAARAIRSVSPTSRRPHIASSDFHSGSLSIVSPMMSTIA